MVWLINTVLSEPTMLFLGSPTATISFILQITSQLKFQVPTRATGAIELKMAAGVPVIVGRVLGQDGWTVSACDRYAALVAEITD